MFSIRKILCPVDFSEGSKAALSYGTRLAAHFDAAVDLLHIAEPSPYDMSSDVIRGESSERGVAGSARTALRARVDALIDLAASAERQRITVLIESGFAAQCILSRLEREDYDLAVLGTAGRKGVAHLVMGSVAERVVRSACCPVLTIRAGSREK